MLRIDIRSRAFKDLEQLSPDVQQQILRKLEYYCSSPSPLSFAHPLKESIFGAYRFRVGDYRVIFTVVENTAVIHKIGHRKDVYKE